MVIVLTLLRPSTQAAVAVPTQGQIGSVTKPAHRPGFCEGGSNEFEYRVCP